MRNATLLIGRPTSGNKTEDLTPSRPGRPRTPPSTNRMQPCPELAALFGVPMLSEDRIKEIRRQERAQRQREAFRVGYPGSARK